MKKVFSILLLVVLLVALLLPATPVLAGEGKEKKNSDTWTTIQDGVLTDSNGNIITVGYDAWGYNYQGRIYNGWYSNYSRPAVPVTEDDTYLQMKWNDAWMSNVDRDGDGKLDRHYGYDSYIGSGAWLTNHMWGEYPDGTKWNYFCKIIAAPVDAYLSGGIWYAADGTEIGPSIWGQFVIIQEVSNDPYYDQHGLIYKSPARAGLGDW